MGRAMSERLELIGLGPRFALRKNCGRNCDLGSELVAQGL